jgi:hypothetical protein
MDDFLQRLHAHDWASEPRSEWKSPDDVPPALVAAWRGEPNAYDRLMAVLANNHAGAWYPVLLSAMPFLHDVLANAPSAGVEAVPGLLEDFVYSFDVDPASPELDRRRAGSPGRAADQRVDRPHCPGHQPTHAVIECNATRLPSLSTMTARKPFGAIECFSFSTLPPLTFAAATAASRRLLASM